MSNSDRPKISKTQLGSVFSLELQLEGLSLNSVWFFTRGPSEETQFNSVTLPGLLGNTQE